MTTKTLTQQAEQDSAAPTTATTTPEPNEPRARIEPRADILELADHVLVVAELPGVDAQGVEIELEKNLLTIRGRSAWLHPADFQMAYAEFTLGDYERSFRIGDGIDRDHIAAVMKDGVLRVTLPKARLAQTLRKKIAVRRED